MAELKQILKETISKYATEGLNDYTYMTSNDDNTQYTIIAVAENNDPPVFMNLIVHLEGDSIIIHHDANDKIVLAYAGETLATAD